jgi:Zn-dependent metalloprotease
MLALTSTSQIADCAKVSVQIAGGPKFGAAAKKAVKAAWKKVGITV